jgi:hypothetical protein
MFKPLLISICVSDCSLTVKSLNGRNLPIAGNMIRKTAELVAKKDASNSAQHHAFFAPRDRPIHVHPHPRSADFSPRGPAAQASPLKSEIFRFEMLF